jgi:hypothetical protein
LDSSSVKDKKRVRQSAVVTKNTELPEAPTINEWEMRAFHLSKTNVELLAKISEKEEEIMHLKKMLESFVENKGGVMKLVISDEEIIAELQIKRLLAQAQIRALTIEETKQFDLFVKNKRLIKGDSTDVIDHKPMSSNKDDLMKIAKINKDKE